MGFLPSARDAVSGRVPGAISRDVWRWPATGGYPPISGGSGSDYGGNLEKHLRDLHPDWSDDKIRREILDLAYETYKLGEQNLLDEKRFFFNPWRRKHRGKSFADYLRERRHMSDKLLSQLKEWFPEYFEVETTERKRR